MIQLREQEQIERGTLINISSISAYAVSLNRPDYCIAKAGLQMMTWLFASATGRGADSCLRNLSGRDRQRHDGPGPGEVRPS